MCFVICRQMCSYCVIVEFRGAGARRRAALPCFSPANIELIDLVILFYRLGALRITSVRFREIINFYTSFNPTLRRNRCL